ncbi:MAG: AraC family transcriptional regulator [Prevotella sp.]|nr:AraC family transcriptional regulator [Prevotella sp.]
MSKIVTEVAPLQRGDCFYIAERHKTSFTYPLHRHIEYELNFVANCRGVRRTVGDSLEVLGDYDLCLLGGGIEHEWKQYQCRSADIYEITIQFADDIFAGPLIEKAAMASIRNMLKDSETGIAFSMEAIMHNFGRIKTLLTLTDSFYQMTGLFEILYELSKTSYRQLASSAFAGADTSNDNRRIQKITDYVAEHFKDDIRLADIASQAGMTPSAFSRFFKLHTHKNISEYIIDTRLGYAARKLADSSMTVLEICYTSGFNNISYFNRIFRKKKGCTPTEFRNNYHKTKIVG